MFTAIARTTLLAAITVTATLGTASADSRLAAPATGEIVVKATAPCHVHPCATQKERHDIFNRRHHGMAAPVGTGGGVEPAATFRWPWQKKKSVERTKF